MAKYAMRIIETLSRTVIVDADDLDEATDKARSAYDSNEVILEADDFEKCEIIPASWTKNGIVPDGRDTKFFTHILGKTNTRIHYLYRDASNYKVSNEITVPGTFTEEQIDAIIGCLMDGEYFIPSKIGFPEKKFEDETEDDHPWFELHKGDFEPTLEEPQIDNSPEEIVAIFQNAKNRWGD